MDRAKRERLERAGWTVGDASTLLGLTPEETAFIELRIALAARLREARRAQGLTQSAVAEQVGSSQSRVAKMEAADGTVTVDLLVQALLALGVDRTDLGRVIAGA